MAEHNNTQEQMGWVRLPKRNELEQFAIVIQLMGSDQVKAHCEDGQERSCRIPGKMKKRVWMRQGDIIIIKLWDFQQSKADVVWRFIGNQKEWLKRKGHLKNLPL